MTVETYLKLQAAGLTPNILVEAAQNVKAKDGLTGSPLEKAVSIATSMLNAKPDLLKAPEFDLNQLIELIIMLMPLIELIISLLS